MLLVGKSVSVSASVHLLSAIDPCFPQLGPWLCVMDDRDSALAGTSRSIAEMSSHKVSFVAANSFHPAA